MRKVTAILFLAILASATVLAQADIPLRNWTVPPYAFLTSGSSQGGLTTMTDVTDPRTFIGIQVCRLLDTRPPANNPLDGDGKFAANEIRLYDVDGLCGIPSGADAVSLNITVTETDSNPFGHVKIWPAAQGEPNVSTLNWNAANQTIANAAIVALTSGQFRVKTGEAGAHVIIDVNGYFSDILTDQTNYLRLENSSTTATIFIDNNSATCSGACGLEAYTSSGYAVYGNALDTLGTAFGVYGEINTLTTGSAAVRGFSDASTGVTYGVWGSNDSVTNASAGVRGTSGTFPTAAVFQNAGVRGEAGVDAIGVLGFSRSYGIIGNLVNSAGTVLTQGVSGLLGFDSINCGGILEPACPPQWGLWAFGNSGATATKYFVDPHPSDPSKVIGYISLEGPEAGTYFRGRGRFQNGTARIQVPEHFRMVTDPEGLTVQITPIGGMATVGVLRADLNEIVVQASRNLEFSYLVQGVRATFKDAPIVWEGNSFRPQNAEGRAPAWLSEGQRARLIANGTYKADGTVNMETAQRLGWDKIWAERERPTQQPTEP